MYDAGKIIAGLAIFLILMLSPFLYNRGDAGLQPNPVKPVAEGPEGVKECVKDTQYMRTSHMVLINEWRDEVLREGKREQVPAGGKMYEKSLMMGCLACHTDKKKFCDECHTYASVTPYCWDCHITRDQIKELEKL